MESVRELGAREGVVPIQKQLRFVMHELRHGFRNVLRRLKRARNLRSATAFVMNHYEIPGEPHFDVRLKCARRTLRNPKGYTGGQC